MDPRKRSSFVDICFFGMKGGSGAMKGVDGYDHIGMIDASGGVLDQDYEMFEQQTPHILWEHEYLQDSAGAGQWRGGLGIQTRYELRGENVKVVTFGDGVVRLVKRGVVQGHDGVAHELVQYTAMGVNRVGRESQIAIDDLDQALRRHLLRKGGESAQISEKYRHLAPIAAQVGTGRIVNEVLRDLRRKVSVE